MSDRAHDLFLLLKNLAQLRSAEQIVGRFVEATSELFGGMSLIWIDAAEPTPPGALEVATPHQRFGCFSVEGGIDGEAADLLSDAVGMLALILEHEANLARLADERELLADTVEDRAADFQRIDDSLRNLVDAIPDVVWTSSANGVTSFVSPSVERVYGFTPDSFEARTTPRVEAFWCFTSPQAVPDAMQTKE